ncbi:hypothetical protein GCM10009122_24190 [Fulvivirga kasyanovii]|uniref:DUF4253 domain-containing protein n=1 Tax=Fulvivirga kasyanovii TaxID=396812 RepID=A0ABW9RY12_9BACT|nr:hypothetical protein [Fulvivirga kasyanovii]MTI28083.1 hypothetical protein [Fulvivirga kasyanovii]
MNIDKYIFIAGPTEEQLNSGLQELAELYSDTGFTEGMSVHKSLKSDNQYIVNFSNMPDFERFKYFVNFLHYPIETQYTAKVMGFWTIGQLDKIPEQFSGKRLLLYVSENDTEGDSVFAIYPGAKSTVKLGFAMGEEYQELESKEFEFVEPQLNNEDYRLVSTISPDPNAKKKSASGCAPVLILFGLLSVGLYLLN